MLALLSVVSFAIALIERHLGPVDMAVLGLLLLALHLAYPLALPGRRV